MPDKTCIIMENVGLSHFCSIRISHVWFITENVGLSQFCSIRISHVYINDTLGLSRYFAAFVYNNYDITWVCERNSSLSRFLAALYHK